MLLKLCSFLLHMSINTNKSSAKDEEWKSSLVHPLEARHVKLRTALNPVLQKEVQLILKFVHQCCTSTCTVCGLWWTLGVASITWPEKSINTDQWKHGYSTKHGAQLHYSPTPNESTVALISENHTNDDLHIGQWQDKQDPGQHLKKAERQKCDKNYICSL